MRILHLISQHPESTGSGFYLLNILRRSVAAGHENYLVAGVSESCHPDLASTGVSSHRFIRFGQGELDFTIPGMSDVMPYHSSRFSELSPDQLDRYVNAFSREIKRAAEEFSPDLIHSHHLWLASSAARTILPEIPMVTSCHSTDLRQFVQCPHLRQRVLKPCRAIDRVLALSGDQKEKAAELYTIPPDRIDIVGSGFDSGLFTFRSMPAHDPVQFLYAGKLSYAKGVDSLLHAFASLGDKDVHLHLAGSGSGEEERQCLQLADKLGPLVTIHGRVDQPKLAELMAESHIFILPSFYEGLPLVLLEALASGCMILTTKLPGSWELLEAAEGDLVHFIALPEMATIDRPTSKGAEHFERWMTDAIVTMAERVRRGAVVEHARVQRLTAPHDWGAVFGRIEETYRAVMRN